MNKEVFSQEIAEAISNYLQKNEWNFHYEKERGMFRFSMALKCEIKSMSYVISVYDDGYTVYGMCPIGVDAHDIYSVTQMSELVNRINWGVISGCFEMDFSDAEIRYRYSTYTGGDVPSDDVIEHSIFIPSSMLKKYSSGIVDIILGRRNAKDAVFNCEHPQVEEKKKLDGPLSHLPFQIKDIEDTSSRSHIPADAEMASLAEQY